MHRSAEEVKQAHIDSMGKNLGPCFHALWNEVAWLYTKWEEYVELFGKKPSRIDLINSAASHFFRIIQDSLFDDCLLHIARLTDPARTAGKENLTITRLPQLIENEDLKRDLELHISSAVKNAEFSRDWRNRRIAHKDLSLALKLGAEPLKPACRAKVSEALQAIAKVINAVSLHYTGSTTMFDLGGNSNGALELLYVIDDGVQAEKDRFERIKSGNFTKRDREIRDL